MKNRSRLIEKGAVQIESDHAPLLVAVKVGRMQAVVDV